MAYIPHESDVSSILSELGFKSIEEAVETFLPSKYLKGFSVDIPVMDDEYELLKYFKKFEAMNKIYKPEDIYVGMGVEPVYIPSLIKYLVSRGEFLTSYTPYQAEMSQGVLQALYEYQSVMAELLEMDVVNSSMYDGASSIAEALLMAERIKGRKRVLIPHDMNRFYKEVVRTYLYGPGISIVEYRFNNSGRIDLDLIEEELKKGISGVYIEFPNIYGYFDEDIFTLEETVHRYDALFIVGFDIWSLPIVIPPGRLNADIAVGEGQPFGLSMGYGGPLLGIFSVKRDMNLIRNMPGRLIGETRTSDGGRAYTMILQTREQHIRRGRATSNICTNEALSAIQTLMFIAYHGLRGLYRISMEMLRLSHRLRDGLVKIGFNEYMNLPFHRRFTVEIGSDVENFIGYMVSSGILPGHQLRDRLIIHLNMMNNDRSIDKYIEYARRWVYNVR